MDSLTTNEHDTVTGNATDFDPQRFWLPALVFGGPAADLDTFADLRLPAATSVPRTLLLQGDTAVEWTQPVMM